MRDAGDVSTHMGAVPSLGALTCGGEPVAAVAAAELSLGVVVAAFCSPSPTLLPSAMAGPTSSSDAVLLPAWALAAVADVGGSAVLLDAPCATISSIGASASRAWGLAATGGEEEEEVSARAAGCSHEAEEALAQAAGTRIRIWERERVERGRLM